MGSFKENQSIIIESSPIDKAGTGYGTAIMYRDATGKAKFVSATNPLPSTASVSVDTMSIDAEMSEATGHDYYVTTTNVGDGTLTIGFDAVAGLTLANIVKVENKTQGWVYITKEATVTTTSIALVAGNQQTGYPACGATDEYEIVYRGVSRFDSITISESIPSAVYNGQKTVTTAGTAEALSTTQACKMVTIKALNTNTGNVYIGNSGVSSSNGLVLEAGESVDVKIDDIATIFIDVDTNGEGASWVAS